jgi:anti-sigma B factor antagonist
MPTTPRITALDFDGVTVIRFLEPRLFEERIVREVGEQMHASIPAEGPPVRLILDFSGVELISSSFLGKLVLLQRRVEGAGGKFRLCEMTPTVQGVFRTSNLDRLFGVDRDLREAMERV